MLRHLCLIATVCAAVPAAALGAPALSVPIDSAQLLTLDVPVTSMFVGNPYIADVTVVDPRHVLVTGKTFGSTNLIGLDAKSKIVLARALTVSGHLTQTVTLNLGSVQRTLTCTKAHCEAAPVPGDSPNTYYDPIHDDIAKREGLAQTQSVSH